MNRMSLAAPVLAATLLAPTAMPAASAAPTSTRTAQGAASFDLDEARKSLKEVNALINTLLQRDASNPVEDFTDEINDLIDIAFDLESAIRAFHLGGVVMFDIQTILPRIELALTVTEVITMATTHLHNKVEQAHVELGFATTKAVLVLINPGSTVARIEAAAAKLQATYERVSNYRDLRDGDRATIYTKSQLDRTIWDVRIKRDRNVLGKTDFMTYATLNRSITKAVGVWGNAWATVGEVKQAEADLNAAYEAAVAKATR